MVMLKIELTSQATNQLLQSHDNHMTITTIRREIQIWKR